MKSKYKIVERLIDQGHIVIKTADRILNKKTGYIQDLQDLHTDGPISTTEVVELLTEREPRKRIKNVPPPVVYNNDQLDSPMYSVPTEPNEPFWRKETIEFPNYPASIVNVLQDTIGSVKTPKWATDNLKRIKSKFKPGKDKSTNNSPKL